MSVSVSVSVSDRSLADRCEPSSTVSGQSSYCKCSEKVGAGLAAGGTRTKRTGTWIFGRIVTFFISHQVNGRCDWSAVVSGVHCWLTLDYHFQENKLPVLGAVALTDRFPT